MKKILLSASALLLSLTLSACSGGSFDSSEMADGGMPESIKGDADLAYDAMLGEVASVDGAGIDGSYDDTASESGEINGMDDLIPAAAGTLTAGEWSDNDHWTFWQGLYQNEETGWENYRQLWNQSYLSRTFVTVTFDGRPVENAAVTVADGQGNTLWQSKTDNTGKAYLFYSPEKLSGGELTVTAEYDNLTETAVITSENSSACKIDLSSDSAYTLTQPSKSLDLMLVVDTTGSMSDELSYLQKELESVINRAVAENGNIPLRLSVNFYRDDGDEYVVRDFGFTSDISEAIAQLEAQCADGGGDTPEKVNAALDNAINGHQWNEDAVKLMFIILDAPPHSEDEQAVSDMINLVSQASQKGIRVIPILASGGDKEAEYIMRDFALKTGGTYLFLTDDSGISVGQHIQPTVGEYQVEKLNDLMVKVINRYLASADAPAEYIDETVQIVLESPEETTENQQ